MKLTVIGFKARIALWCMVCGLFVDTAVYADNKQVAANEKQCKHIYNGEVLRGKDLKIDIDSGLFFYLRPSHDPAIEGWNIQIRPKNGPDQDYAWLLNIPYRAYNATHVDTSYGFTAKDAVSYGPRELMFPLTPASAEKAFKLYEMLVRGIGIGSRSTDEVLKEMEGLPSGKALFTIIDSKIGKSGIVNQERGRIDWLKFELTITLPCGLTEQIINK